MHLLRVLLVPAVAILASHVGNSAATETGQSMISTLVSPESPISTITGQRRSLRTDKSTEAEDDDFEARCVWKHIKVRWWLETEKIDDYVKEALKLKGLEGDALTSHKNYKYFKYFAKKSEDYLLNKWLRKDTPTFEAWKNLELEGITKREVLTKNIVKSENFRIYERYVNAFNTNVERTINAGYDPPS